MKEIEPNQAELAEEILDITRSRLLMNMRFMAAAIGRLRWAVWEAESPGTDGETVWYSPGTVLRRYVSDPANVNRDCIHMILHCIFRHMFLPGRPEKELWSLSCDIAVSYSISSLKLSLLDDEAEPLRIAVYDRLKRRIKGILTAERIYRALLNDPPSPQDRLALAQLFSPDNHELWYRMDEPRPAPGNSSIGEECRAQDRNSLAEQWKAVSEKIRAELVHEPQQGCTGEVLAQEIRKLNRERYDYASFLRRFTASCEVMEQSETDFDYIYYTYGLKTYGNMPLIEPLEYREDGRRIRELAIVIDTSGSVAGKQVQSFLQKTYNILKQQDCFSGHFILHLIQCDSEVQSDHKITCQKDFDDLMKTMKLKGFGDTDFRPAFDYVQHLIDADFRDLRGLLYFTDGWGTFPSSPPPYETAFLFIEENDNDLSVPPWATKLILPEEETENEF